MLSPATGNEDPSASDRRDRAELMAAGLDQEMLTEVLRLSERGRAWMIIKDWSVDVRHLTGTKFPSRR